MYNVLSYIKMNNWYMVIYLIILYLKLWWKVPCDCPYQSQYYHSVEVMYWPRTAYHWKGQRPEWSYGPLQRGGWCMYPILG